MDIHKTWNFLININDIIKTKYERPIYEINMCNYNELLNVVFNSNHLMIYILY